MKDAFALVLCCIYLLILLTNVSIEANSVDPDLDLSLFVEDACKTIQQMRKRTTFVVIGHLMVKSVWYLSLTPRSMILFLHFSIVSWSNLISILGHMGDDGDNYL